MAEPLGVADTLLFDVPATSLPRVTRLVDGNWPAALAARADDSLFFRAAMQPTLLGNQPEYLTLDIPSPGRHDRGGGRPDVCRAHRRGRRCAADRSRPLTRINTVVVTADPDRVLGAPIPKGLGYFLGLPEMGPHAGVFGCKGSGGSIALADPGHGFAFAFTHNRLTAPPTTAPPSSARRSASAPNTDPDGRRAGRSTIPWLSVSRLRAGASVGRSASQGRWMISAA